MAADKLCSKNYRKKLLRDAEFIYAEIVAKKPELIYALPELNKALQRMQKQVEKRKHLQKGTFQRLLKYSELGLKTISLKILAVASFYGIVFFIGLIASVSTVYKISIFATLIASLPAIGYIIHSFTR